MDTAGAEPIRKLLEKHPGLHIEVNMGQYLRDRLDNTDGPAKVDVIGADTRTGVPRRITVDLAEIRRRLSR